MSDSNPIKELLRNFYYSAMIPVNYIRNEKSVFRIPDELAYINEIIRDAYSLEQLLQASAYEAEAIGQSTTYYFRNIYDECFLILNLNDEEHVLVGPFLNEKIYEGSVNNIIRENRLQIKLKNKLMSYYDRLPVVHTNRSYHCGKLLDRLFELGTLPPGELKGEEASISYTDDYFAEMTRNRESLFHHPPYFLEQELSTKIKSGNLSDALSVLAEINALTRTRLSEDPIRSLKNSLICSITLFTRAAIDGGVIPEVAFTLSDSLIMELESMTNVSKLIHFEYGAVREYVRIVQDLSKSKYSNIIQQAISYIYKNLTIRITLEGIAKAIFVHPNYLSSLFKKEVGMNLSEFIVKTRITESMYYIRYTNTKISDIASFYQFCNQSYFTQSFRKWIGMTPNEYRIKNNLQNE